MLLLVTVQMYAASEEAGACKVLAKHWRPGVGKPSHAQSLPDLQYSCQLTGLMSKSVCKPISAAMLPYINGIETC